MENIIDTQNVKLALEQLDLDAKIRLTLLLEEFLHTVNIIHFFAKNQEQENKGTSLASVFRKLEDIPKSVIETFKEVINRYQKFSDLANKDGQNFEDLLNLFSKYVKYSFKEKDLLQEMDFIMTKLVSILESFPSYYPSPKESSIKDATKIHFYLEKLSEDFPTLFMPFTGSSHGNSTDIKAFFFWKFNPEINFLKNEKRLFIINSDSFLPNRQITWIILAHEALHYLYYVYGHEDREDNLFKKIKEYATQWEVITAKAFTRNRIFTSKIDAEIYFIDALIDVILTEIFSYKYAFPALLYLFALDEGESVSLPDWNRFWTIRYKAIMEHVKKKIKNERNEQIKDLIYSFENLFEIYKYIQKFYGFPNISNLYLEEEILFNTSKELIETFLKDSSVKENIEKVKEHLDLYRNNLKYLKTYLLTLNKYYEYLIEKIQGDGLTRKEYKRKEYKEGRAFCRTLLETTLYGYQEVKNKNIKDYFEKPVYKFQFYRVRYDDNKNNINELYGALMGRENSLREFIDAYCFGSYTFLYISKEEEHEKVSKYEKCIEDGNSFEILEEILSSYNENEGNENPCNENNATLKKCPEIFLMCKLRFFRYDYSLTLYDGDKESLENIIFKSSKDYIYIFIKYNVNNVKDFREINDLFDSFKREVEKHCEDISIFHFISFEWYDYLTLIVVKPSENNIHLNNDVLKPLKEKVLINNGEKLGRTETDIFIGLNILDKVIVKIPHIHLRVSSEYLGKTKEIIVEPLRREFRVVSRFGIRDLVIKHRENEYFEDSFKEILRKIYSRVLSNEEILNRENNGIKFSDIQFIVEVEIN